MFGATRRDRAFKDYCLILQVHPEADAAMVDAAYWHLAKRYNEAAAHDSQARAKLEELNEAYIILGSAGKREAYMKLRKEILGEGALPQVPQPTSPAPPLSVMSRQRLQEREAPTIHPPRRRRLPVGALIGTVVLLTLMSGALAVTTSATITLGTLAGLLLVLVGATAIVGVRHQRPAAKVNPAEDAEAVALPSHTAVASNYRRGTTDSLEREDEHYEEAPRPTAAPREPLERQAAEQSFGAPRPEIDQLAAHTARLRIVARELSEAPNPPPGDPASAEVDGAAQRPVDRAEIERIKRETELLRHRARQGNPAIEPDSSPQKDDGTLR
jgi:hypothetical protein